MATTHTRESLDRLHRDLGLSPLSHWWGRAEIFLGLLAMGGSLVLMLALAVEVIQQAVAKVPFVTSIPLAPAVGAAVLFALGGYLALAGHRRHLYESNNRLTAYLADLVRPAERVAADVPEPVAPLAAATIGDGIPLGAGLA
jgi:hypothetical protein